MAEYIEREDAIRVVNGKSSLAMTRSDLIDSINAIHSIDAVVVTLCKDCKHYANHPNGLCYLHTEPKENARGYAGDAACVEPDDFCNYGKPKEG